MGIYLFNTSDIIHELKAEAGTRRRMASEGTPHTEIMKPEGFLHMYLFVRAGKRPGGADIR